VPTLAELCGIGVHDLSFEGKSLVTQLFSGRADHARVVFSETNAPGKQRAAITEAWKLIYYINTNVYELFDLAADPWEHTNLAPNNPPALATMQQTLQNWMDRVMYARDPNFNQAYRYLADVIAKEQPPVATTGQTIADGAIEVSGIGRAPEKPFLPATTTDVHVYFTAKTATAKNLKFQLVLWPKTSELTDPVPGNASRSGLRATADGVFPTTQWKPGDRIRERFTVTIPGTWQGDTVVGLVVQEAGSSDRDKATGPAPNNDPTIAILGVLPLPAGGSPTPPPP
jgi:hypothetical protein